ASLTLYGTATPGVPVITSSQTAGGLAGIAFHYQPAATNAPSSWNATALPPGLTIDGTTGLITGTPAGTGTFPVSITATNSAGSGNATLTITVTAQPPGIPQALDDSGLVFETVGREWLSQAVITHDGVDAARSGSIPDKGISGLKTTVTGPLTVAFWWRVSSEEDFDKLRFIVDNTEAGAISGEVDWTRMAAIIPAGTHTLRWSYEKDDGSASGADAGWVDEVTFHSFVAPLKAAGAGTGFQDPALNAAVHIRTTGTELGWTSGGGKVVESGNRNPPLTGPVTTATAGVRSFEINDAPAWLRTDAVDLSGYLNIAGEADVRAYTTNSNNFESPDLLHIHLELSNDLATWTDGPDILAPRTGGTGAADMLIALNTAGNNLYNHFTSAAGAVPAGTRYARVVVSGVTDGTSEHLVVDNLRITGTPSHADEDADGFPAELEAWFGTSDHSPDIQPHVSISTPEGNPGISFPSLRGYSYVIETSPDLLNWTAETILATASVTLWVNPAGPEDHRYYRVRRP
ncbi:MAG TPA: Ig domain-containing protein, partial [Verrucomicrobiales bacterium]|nr:Ig domain-containing protein [Verrucomicrobiales bacterium]